MELSQDECSTSMLAENITQYLEAPGTYLPRPEYIDSSFTLEVSILIIFVE